MCVYGGACFLLTSRNLKPKMPFLMEFIIPDVTAGDRLYFQLLATPTGSVAKVDKGALRYGKNNQVTGLQNPLTCSGLNKSLSL